MVCRGWYDVGTRLVRGWYHPYLVYLGEWLVKVDLRFFLSRLCDESALDFFSFLLFFFRLGSRSERDYFPFFNEHVYDECAIAPVQI